MSARCRITYHEEGVITAYYSGPSRSMVAPIDMRPRCKICNKPIVAGERFTVVGPSHEKCARALAGDPAAGERP